MNTKSCDKKRVCTELSQPQTPYTLFEGTNKGEIKEEKIKNDEKTEYD